MNQGYETDTTKCITSISLLCDITELIMNPQQEKKNINFVLFQCLVSLGNAFYEALSLC